MSTVGILGEGASGRAVVPVAVAEAIEITGKVLGVAGATRIIETARDDCLASSILVRIRSFPNKV
jgi:hypothetical protein